MTDPSDALETRTGLPDALRVLLEEYPRDAWRADPGFGELIRFWLERHVMFRRLLERLEADAARALEREIEPRVYAGSLARFGSIFTSELHGHHMIEDRHYFPRLSRLDARVSRGFEILDADHHALDGHLEGFAETANGLLSRVAAGEAHERPLMELETRLRSFERFLDRHLVDEEELVVPVLLKYQPAGMT